MKKRSEGRNALIDWPGLDVALYPETDELFLAQGIKPPLNVYGYCVLCHSCLLFYKSGIEAKSFGEEKSL